MNNKKIISIFSLSLLSALGIYAFLFQQNENPPPTTQAMNRPSSVNVANSANTKPSHPLTPSLAPSLSLNVSNPTALEHQSTKKIRQIKDSSPESFIQLDDTAHVKMFKMLSYPMLLDFYACDLQICSSKDAVFSDNFYVINKMSLIDNFQDSRTYALFKDPNNNNEIGIWNKKILITTENEFSYDLEGQLSKFKIEQLKNPIPTVYIATYIGQIDELDESLSKLKSLPLVKDVSLDIMFSRKK